MVVFAFVVVHRAEVPRISVCANCVSVLIRGYLYRYSMLGWKLPLSTF